MEELLDHYGEGILDVATTLLIIISCTSLISENGILRLLVQRIFEAVC